MYPKTWVQAKKEYFTERQRKMTQEQKSYRQQLVELAAQEQHEELEQLARYIENATEGRFTVEAGTHACTIFHDGKVVMYVASQETFDRIMEFSRLMCLPSNDEIETMQELSLPDNPDFLESPDFI